MVAEEGDIHQGGCGKPSVDKRASSARGDPPERWKKGRESNVVLVLQWGAELTPSRDRL